MQDKLKRVREEEVAREPEGLKDGGHVYPTCSNCSARLMDLWVTRPWEKQTWKVRATCPFCGDKSFTVEVKGGFHFGGIARKFRDDPNNDDVVTTVERFDIVGDTFEFTVKKAKEDAKPVRG